jgi:aryl-alcohol dehydrogenase-like predicted oxidoreductase
VPATRLALTWVLSRPGISTMLCGARTIAQVDQAWEAWAQRAQLADAVQRLTERSREFIEPPGEEERAAAIGVPSR